MFFVVASSAVGLLYLSLVALWVVIALHLRRTPTSPTSAPER